MGTHEHVASVSTTDATNTATITAPEGSHHSRTGTVAGDHSRRTRTTGCGSPTVNIELHGGRSQGGKRFGRPLPDGTTSTGRPAFRKVSSCHPRDPVCSRWRRFWIPLLALGR